MTEPRKFANCTDQPYLPWLVGLTALVLYLATVCHGITADNIPMTALAAGWNADPVTARPLTWLAAMSLRWVPEHWIPLALNLQSAVFAAATVGVLARCVQLLPLNRYRIQRLFLRNSSQYFRRGDAWVAPVVAALACGLEPTFWHEAVSATGETLDILILSLAAWCYLELRYSELLCWLDRFAFVWGLGMAENWCMVAGLPLFLALIFIQWRFACLSLKFWLRVILGWGLGFSVLLVLPLANSVSPDSSWSFLHGLLVSLQELGQHVVAPKKLFDRHTEIVALLFFYLLPVLPLLFKLRTEGHYEQSLQSRIEMFFLQAGFLVMFAAGLAGTVHLAFGPHHFLAQFNLLSGPLLDFVWLNGLGVGYLTAHFLLICRADLAQVRRRNPHFRLPPFLPEWLRRGLAVVVCLVPVGLAVGLPFRTWPELRQIQDTPALDFARHVVADLPPGGGVLLCPEPRRLATVRALLDTRPDFAKWAPVDSTQLASPQYRAQLERKWPLGWTAFNTSRPLRPNELLYLLDQISANAPLYALQPGIGPVYERFYLEPHGLYFRMVPFTGDLAPDPVPGPAIIRENEAFWSSQWTNHLAQWAGLNGNSHKRIRLWTLEPLRVVYHPIGTEWYARSLNRWGVELERAGQWDAAGQRFEQAVQLDAANLVSLANRDLNRARRTGTTADDTAIAPLTAAVQSHPSRLFLGQLAEGCDVPEIDAALAKIMLESQCPRQAIHFMSRAVELNPDQPEYQIDLAQYYLQARLRSQSWHLIHQLQQNQSRWSLTPDQQTQLQQLQSDEWLNSTNAP